MNVAYENVNVVNSFIGSEMSSMDTVHNENEHTTSIASVAVAIPEKPEEEIEAAESSIALTEKNNPDVEPEPEVESVSNTVKEPEDAVKSTPTEIPTKVIRKRKLKPKEASTSSIEEAKPSAEESVNGEVPKKRRPKYSKQIIYECIKCNKEYKIKKYFNNHVETCNGKKTVKRAKAVTYDDENDDTIEDDVDDEFINRYLDTSSEDSAEYDSS